MRDWDSLPSVHILWKDITGCISSWSYFKAVVLRFGILWVIHYFLIPTVKDIGLLCSHAREQCVLCEKQPGLNLWCSNILLPQNREGREALHGPSKGLSQINVRRFLGVGMKSDHPSPLSLWVLGLWDKSLFLRQPSQVTSSCCIIYFFLMRHKALKKKKQKETKKSNKMENPSSHRSEVSLWQICPSSYMYCCLLSSSGQGRYFWLASAPALLSVRMSSTLCCSGLSDLLYQEELHHNKCSFMVHQFLVSLQ